MRSSRYPALAHVWALGWTTVPAGLGVSAWWALQRGGTDPAAPLWWVYHSLVIFLYAGTAAVLSQLAVPLLAAVPALRRTRPALLGLLAGAVGGAVAIGLGH